VKALLKKARFLFGKASFFLHRRIIYKYIWKKYMISESSLKGRSCKRNNDEFVKTVDKSHPRHFSYENEMAITRSLEKQVFCPNFIRYKETETTSHFYYRFHDYCSIADVMKHQIRMSLSQYKSLESLLYSTLAALATARIIHRDINPSNILVSDNFDVVMLLDYQWAVISGREISTSNASDESELDKCLLALNKKYRGPNMETFDFENDEFSVQKILSELSGQVEK
jgi:serine/threonine protein kinase